MGRSPQSSAFKALFVTLVIIIYIPCCCHAIIFLFSKADGAESPTVLPSHLMKASLPLPAEIKKGTGDFSHLTEKPSSISSSATLRTSSKSSESTYTHWRMNKPGFVKATKEAKQKRDDILRGEYVRRKPSKSEEAARTTSEDAPRQEELAPISAVSTTLPDTPSLHAEEEPPPDAVTDAQQDNGDFRDPISTPNTPTTAATGNRHKDTSAKLGSATQDHFPLPSWPANTSQKESHSPSTSDTEQNTKEQSSLPSSASTTAVVFPGKGQTTRSSRKRRWDDALAAEGPFNGPLIIALSRLCRNINAVSNRQKIDFGDTGLTLIDMFAVRPHEPSSTTQDLAILAYKGQYCIVAFRGSANVANWINNLDMRWARFRTRKSGETIAFTHAGFTATYELLRGLDSNFMAQVRICLGSSRKLILTGHSRGASLASLMALDILVDKSLDEDGTGQKVYDLSRFRRPKSEHLLVYTFGEPRSLSQGFGNVSWENVTEPITKYRFIHPEDIVPNMPGAPYQHWGTLHALKPEKGVDEPTEENTGTKPQLMSMVAYILQKYTLHESASYADLVEYNFLPATEMVGRKRRKSVPPLSSRQQRLR